MVLLSKNIPKNYSCAFLKHFDTYNPEKVGELLKKYGNFKNL